MLYNNIDMSDYMRIIDIRGRGLTEQELTTVRVIGSDEDYVTYRTKPPRYLEIDYEIRAKNKEELRKKIDEVSAIIETTEKVPIIFPDELDRTYFGEYAGVEESVEYHHVGIHRGTIYILRDKYKYGTEKVVEPSSDTFIVKNNGTADTEPIFELTAKEPTTFAMVSNGEEYMMVGRPYNVDEVPTEKYESVFSTNASSLVGWSTIPSGSTIDEGVVGGNMAVHGGYSFYAESFGDNPNGWVGPAIKQSLTRPVQDFRMTMDMALFNRQGNVGKIVVSLLDEADNVIASVQMVDATNSAWRNRAIIRVGTANQGYDLINHAPERGGWNDFRGVLRIERIGNEFKAYVANVTDGRHHGRLNSQPYYDRLGEYSAKVAQVRVYIAKARHYEPFPMYFHGGNVWEIHDLDASQIEYIADEGDRIVFDHKTGDCYINGEPVPFDFGADFFKLKKGVNNLAVLPEDTFDVSIKYRERYK